MEFRSLYESSDLNVTRYSNAYALFSVYNVHVALLDRSRSLADACEKSVDYCHRPFPCY